tara:strand:+ start:1349 stop:1600 length:252 start_codon:yes stop_codon:yes gene_type:complete
MRTFKGVIEGFIVVLAILAAFALGREYSAFEAELDYAQAKGQCSSTEAKTRYLSKQDEGWICFIQHWDDKRKPRITMSRLTLE